MVSLEIFFDIILPATLWPWGLTQPPTVMITRNISWSKGGRCVGLTSSPPSCADCLEIWEPRSPGTLCSCNRPVQGLFCLFMCTNDECIVYCLIHIVFSSVVIVWLLCSFPDDVGDQLCERVLSVLFEVWLLACARCFPSPPLWKTFRETCMNWRHRIALIEQWNRVNLALTARLLEFMYGPSYPELKICEFLQDLLIVSAVVSARICECIAIEIK